MESKCDIICFQETKREHFDMQFLKKFCPPQFLPSNGALGECITIWKNSKFDGSLAFSNEYGVFVDFNSRHSGARWILTNIYRPCTHERKVGFLEWLNEVDMHEQMDWLLVGDFNLLRSPDDSNKPGGDITEMIQFNEAISNQGLIKIPLQ